MQHLFPNVAYESCIEVAIHISAGGLRGREGSRKSVSISYFEVFPLFKVVSIGREGLFEKRPKTSANM